MSIAKCTMRELEQSFLEFLEQPVKLKIFLVTVNNFYSMGALEQFIKISRATSKTEDFSRDHKQL